MLIHLTSLRYILQAIRSSNIPYKLTRFYGSMIKSYHTFFFLSTAVQVTPRWGSSNSECGGQSSACGRFDLHIRASAAANSWRIDLKIQILEVKPPQICSPASGYQPNSRSGVHGEHGDKVPKGLAATSGNVGSGTNCCPRFPPCYNISINGNYACGFLN
jgi:hypothetical protein